MHLIKPYDVRASELEDEDGIYISLHWAKSLVHNFLLFLIADQ